MPYQQLPKFKPEPEKVFEIPTPAMGGINLRDLEFEQEPNQSPYMLNVMYRNGAFGKRYGQEVYATFDDEVYSAVYFDDSIFVHSGTKIYQYSSGATQVASGMPESSGLFIVYAQKLYYLISSGFYVFNGIAFTTVDAYVPDLLINCEPDGTHSDLLDEYNLMSDHFSYLYNGGGTAVVDYEVGVYDGNNVIDWSEDANHKHSIVVEVDDVVKTEGTDYTVNATDKKITFVGNGPDEGSLNVKFTFTLIANTFQTERTQILSCKYYDTFGGSNNSRLFIAGCGYSKYFFTQAYDISYFPESNFATLGNTEEDITGFGRQYNVLIVFKPREVFSIYSYTETSSTTVMEEQIGMEAFRSQLVNASIGCDAPHSIQLVNNLLTWFNSTEGVCTLVSTNIQDERNVRIISRNIDYTNNFGVKGVLDYDEDLNLIQSADYGNRYFLVFPTSGMCFMWDYEIQPYVVTSRGDTDPRKLDWFLFDHFYVKQFLKVGKQLMYINTYHKEVHVVFDNTVTNGDFSDSFNGWNNTGFMSTGSGYAGMTLTSEGQLSVYLTQNETVQGGHKYYVSMKVQCTAGAEISTPVCSGTIMSYQRKSKFIEIPEGTTTYNFRIVVSNKRLGISSTVKVGEIMMFDVTGYDLSLEQIDNAVDSYISHEEMDVSLSEYRNTLTKLNSNFRDLDYDGDGTNDYIHSYYMTPFLQFGSVEMLKNVKNIYIQCRGDNNTKINLSYYTNESEKPEQDPNPITVGGKGVLWDKFLWNNMVWSINSWANTFRRRCNLRHIQMCALFCENNESADMSIANIGFRYSYIRYIN